MFIASLNQVDFKSLDEIIESIDIENKTITPTNYFRKIWENPKSGRGSLDKFQLNTLGNKISIVAGSDWSNDRVQFWHEKLILLLTEKELQDFASNACN